MKEKRGVLGPVAAGCSELLAGVGVTRWKAWSAVEKCLLKLLIIVDLSVVTVFLSLSQWAAGKRWSYFPWTLQCPRTFWS